MVTSTSHLDDVKIGEVFTPLQWAEWLLERWGIYDAWIAGASICDPTAGRGIFALALLRLASLRGECLSPELLSRITLIELHAKHLASFKNDVSQQFAVDFPPSQLVVRDVILDPPSTRFDYLVGNPPWANFTDLPAPYKDELKPYFVAEGLVPDKRKALLGSSRTDVAALVLKVVLGKLLSRHGVGGFYLPLSLFSGDDAHRGFRDYIANHRRFAVEEVCEFSESKVFDGVGTTYCCAKFKMDQMQKFPVRYFRESSGAWVEHRAIPLNAPSDQWRVLADGESDTFDDKIDVALRPEQKPRQGVNTCGANKVFMFDEKPLHLPEEFVFPLVTKDIWKRGAMVPVKWILLPYDRYSGKPLSWQEIEKHPGLCRHLTEAKEELQQRKGTLIRSSIAKGIWWALLGVGRYSFAPYKVIWEAYGKNDFVPLVLGGYAGQVWQANQAMQAFIPCWDEDDANRICADLTHPSIRSLLKQLNGDGKCNWAQPGKLKKVLSFDRPECYQPLLIAEGKTKY